MSDDHLAADRDALVALLDRMIRAEARTEAPPESERGEWLYGGVGALEFTEPDRSADCPSVDAQGSCSLAGGFTAHSCAGVESRLLTWALAGD
jgi:hypothetical protein